MNLCTEHQMPRCRLCKEPDTRIEVPGSTLKVRVREQQPRKPLKKSPRKRPMKPEAMSELLADVILRDGRCVAIDHTETMCEGPTEAHHLVPQRVLKAHYPEGHEVFSETANCVALCSRHHSNVERGLLRLPAEALPWNFKLFLMHRGFLDWWEAQELRRVA